MINILLVEDDKPLALGVVYALEDEGFKVFHSVDLQSARKLFKENKIDIILLDVLLGEDTGYELCKEIRRKNEDIAIIFMTACDEESNVVLGLDLGGDDYIIKPIRLRELTSRINAVLRRKGKSIKSENKDPKLIVYKTRDLLIDKGRHKVIKKDEDVNLTLSEYRLLVALVENYPNVMSRNNLLERIWDADGVFVDANTLNVYMKRLREKIEDENSNFIETVRGVGYRWNCEVKK